MAMNLLVNPKTPPLSWAKFVKTTPPRVIALDGYVAEGPRFSPVGPRVNFNHHEKVSRLETRATCAQVLMAIRMGLMDAMRHPDGHLDFGVYVNDCDEDVSLSCFLLRNPDLVTSCMNPLLNRLVTIEDFLDTTAGAYPFPKDLGVLEEVMWVFRPYHQFRVIGGLDRRDDKEFASVIHDVGSRIMSHITGHGQRIDLDTRFNVIGKGNRPWTMVMEVGANARLGLYGSGIKAFVSVRELKNGRYVYTLGRSSLFVPFPIPRYLKALNKIEGATDDLWGGSDTVAGSPRVGGSRLNPDVVTSILDECDGQRS